MAEEYRFTREVTRGEDGVYRWIYDADMSTQGAAFGSMVKVCAIIGALIAAACAFMGTEMFLIGLIVLAGMVGLPALTWVIMYRGKNAKQSMWYEMSEEKLRVPGIYRAGNQTVENSTGYGAIRSVSVRPGQNLIELRTVTMTLFQVYVRTEDFNFVKEYIISRAPKAKVSEEA